MLLLTSAQYQIDIAVPQFQEWISIQIPSIREWAEKLAFTRRVQGRFRFTFVSEILAEIESPVPVYPEGCEIATPSPEAL